MVGKKNSQIEDVAAEGQVEDRRELLQLDAPRGVSLLAAVLAEVLVVAVQHLLREVVVQAVDQRLFALKG